MKIPDTLIRALMTFIIFAVLLTAWPAQAEPAALVQVLPQTALNVGEFRSEETRQATFQLVNQSQGPVRISKVRAGCSCTAVATFSQEPIPPGGNGSITLKITGSSLREGPFDRSATVEFEGISITPVTLRYQGTIIRNVVIQPQREVFLGYLKSPDTGWRQEFIIHGPLSDGRRLRLGTPIASERLNLEIQEKEPSRYQLIVTPKMPQNLGPLREEVRLPILEPQGLPPEVITLKAQIGPQLFLVPMILDLPAGQVPVEKTILASFRHTAQERLHAAELTFTVPAGVTVSGTDVKDGVMLHCQFAPEALQPGSQGVIEVTTPRSGPTKLPFYIKRPPVANPDAH